MPAGHLTAHGMVSAIICNNGRLIIPLMPDYRLMDICWLTGWGYLNTPHGYLLAHGMVSDRLLTTSRLIPASRGHGHLTDRCWLMGWYLISS